ncbi:VirB3 family type IV secretion system protein [Mesorhizobium sp. SARCC-RB16n]|uniref:VirB3 family type IV secretion system protein n=1 Tax=Mesorhizobium sp. SARCC-RB16n TaxID=2116687 RepID=UPI001FEE3CE0|nr:VirB3 family type IV secretion system protein [Mesorhizobium sp. SARCC-RB16n]
MAWPQNDLDASQSLFILGCGLPRLFKGVLAIQRTTLFVGLTREVAFAGLPITYLVVLICAVMLGFLITQSFLYLAVVGGGGYCALRALAAYDPKIIDVFIATVQSTRMSAALLKGEGQVYRA